MASDEGLKFLRLCWVWYGRLQLKPRTGRRAWIAVTDGQGACTPPKHLHLARDPFVAQGDIVTDTMGSVCVQSVSVLVAAGSACSRSCSTPNPATDTSALNP